MQMMGYGGVTGGPLSGGGVPLPKAPVAHRGRPPRKPSGFVVHNPVEFTAEAVEKSAKAAASFTARGPGLGRRADAIDAKVIAQIVEAYTVEKLSIKGVAKKVGVSPGSVQKYLKAEGVQMRPKHYTSPGVPVSQTPTKTCGFCGVEFGRREGERLNSYNQRTCCSMPCSGKLAASKRRKKAA